MIDGSVPGSTEPAGSERSGATERAGSVPAGTEPGWARCGCGEMFRPDTDGSCSAIAQMSELPAGADGLSAVRGAGGPEEAGRVAHPTPGPQRSEPVLAEGPARCDSEGYRYGYRCDRRMGHGYLHFDAQDEVWWTPAADSIGSKLIHDVSGGSGQ